MCSYRSHLEMVPNETMLRLAEALRAAQRSRSPKASHGGKRGHPTRADKKLRDFSGAGEVVRG